MTFHFKGKIPASKSLYNRALICSSFESSLKLVGESKCDDVLKMKEALALLDSTLKDSKPAPSIQNPSLHKSSENFLNLECGDAGTVLRFLTYRVSRIPGVHTLTGSPRLFSRPQKELISSLEKLGVKAEVVNEKLILKSQGWKPTKSALHIDRTQSSQFISGIILSAWGLDFPLHLTWDTKPVSDAYWKMTLDFVNSLGMNFDLTENSITILPNQQIKKDFTYLVESDLSSAFAVAALAAVSGKATFEDFPFESKQPDFEFINLLVKMGVQINFSKKTNGMLSINKTIPLQPIEIDLNNEPDLFPVLATLCAYASGPSRLFGAPQLIFKESNRIKKVAELLTQMGATVEPTDEGIVIFPANQVNLTEAFEFDTDHDHRMAFAAGIAKASGVPLIIKNKDVVNKSFPEFWRISGL